MTAKTTREQMRPVVQLNSTENRAAAYTSEV